MHIILIECILLDLSMDVKVYPRILSSCCLRCNACAFGHYPCKCLDSINLSRLLYNSLVPSLQMRKCCWHLNYSNMASSVSTLLCLAVCLFVCLFTLSATHTQQEILRAKVIESWLHQPHHRYQKWIFDWYTSLFPGRYIPVVTSP